MHLNKHPVTNYELHEPNMLQLGSSSSWNEPCLSITFKLTVMGTPSCGVMMPRRAMRHSPVEVLTKCAPASEDMMQPSIISFGLSPPLSNITLTTAPLPDLHHQSEVRHSNKKASQQQQQKNTYLLASSTTAFISSKTYE